MTTKFNNGDKLRVVTECCSRAREGNTGVVRGGRWVRDSDELNHELGGRFDDHFEVIRPTLEVGKTYKVTGPLVSVAGEVAFRGDVPQPTELKVLRLFDTGNAYVEESAGKKQYVVQTSLGAEVVAEATPEAYVPQVGDRVEVTLRPNGNSGGISFIGETVEVVEYFPRGTFISDEDCVRVRRDSGNTPAIFADQVKKVEPAPLVLEEDKEYKLLATRSLDGARDAVYFKPEVTRVRLTRLNTSGSARVVAVNGGETDRSYAGRAYLGVGESQSVDQTSLAALDSEEETPADPKDVLIEEQKAEMLKLQTLLREAQQKHEKDVEKIGELFMEEARSRGWCSDYDNFVINEVNPELSVELPTRQRDYEVTFTFSQTITVTALSADEAVDIAREDDSYKESGSWGGDLSEDDYSVEEA